MTISRLSRIMDLDADDTSSSSVEKIEGMLKLITQQQLRSSKDTSALTLDDRSNLYLNAVYGARVFTGDEYSDARKLILEEMASNIARSNGSTPRATEGRVGGVEVGGPAFEAAAPLFSIQGAEPAFDVRPFIAERASEYRRSPNRPVQSRREFGKTTIFGATGSVLCLLVISTGAVVWYLRSADRERTAAEIRLEQPAAGIAENIQAHRELAQQPPTHEPVQLSSVSKPDHTLADIRSEQPSLGIPAQRLGIAASGAFGNIEAPLESRQRAPTPDRSVSELSQRLFELGNKLVRKGDLYGGRIVLAEAADEGSASAALNLGISFDPTEDVSVKKHNSDPEKAKFWYERALALGEPTARAKLDKLKLVQSKRP